MTFDLIILIAIDAFLFIGSQYSTAGRGIPFPPLIWGGILLWFFVQGIFWLNGQPFHSLAYLVSTLSPETIKLIWYLLLAECVIFVLYRIRPIRSKRFRVTVHGNDGGFMGGWEFTRSFSGFDDAAGFMEQMRSDARVTGLELDDIGNTPVLIAKNGTENQSVSDWQKGGKK